MMLRGCSILVLQPPDEAVPAARELRDRVAASGAASSSVNGEPPLEANKLTHIVAEGWATVATRAPSLAARHSGAYSEFAPPVSSNGPLMFVTRSWLDDSLAAGRRLAEAEYSFAASESGAARAPKQRKFAAAAAVPSPDQRSAAKAEEEDDRRRRPRQLSATRPVAELTDQSVIDLAGSQDSQQDDPAPPLPSHRQLQRDDDDEEAQCTSLLVQLFEAATVGPSSDGAQRCIKVAARILQNEVGESSKARSLNYMKTERRLCGCDESGGCDGPHAPHCVSTMRLLTVTGFRLVRSGDGSSSKRQLACAESDGRVNLRAGVRDRLLQMKATIDQAIAEEHARRTEELAKLQKAMQEAAAFHRLSESTSDDTTPAGRILSQNDAAEQIQMQLRPSTNALKINLGAAGSLQVRAGSAWQYGPGTIATFNAETPLSEIFLVAGSQLPGYRTHSAAGGGGKAVRLRIGGAGGRLLIDELDGALSLYDVGLHPGMHLLHLVEEGTALSGQAGGEEGSSPWISAAGKPSFLRVRWERAAGLPSGHPQVINSAAPAQSPIVLIKNMDGRRGQTYLDETLKHVSAGQIRNWKGGGADFIRGGNGQSTFQQIFAEGVDSHFGKSSSSRISSAWTRLADAAMQAAMGAAVGSDAEAKRSLAQQTAYYFCSGLMYASDSKLPRHIDAVGTWVVLLSIGCTTKFFVNGRTIDFESGDV